MNEEKKARRKNLLRSILTAAALFVIGLGLVGWSSYALELFTVVAGVYMVLSGLLRIRDAVSVKRAGRNMMFRNTECFFADIFFSLSCLNAM